MKELVQKFIDTEINSMLKLHNGSCQLVDVENGVASIRLQGGCSGCPSSHITLYNFISPYLKDNFSDIKDVVLV